MTKLYFLILFISISIFSFGQNARKYSNEFLSIGVGANSLGRSGAVAATIDDATSGYWNPAGLTGVKNNLQLSLMHSQYFAGIGNYDFVSLAAPLKKRGVLGFSFNRFGIDDIVNTLELIQNGQVNYNRIKTFSAIDYAGYISYAQKLGKLEPDSNDWQLSLGGSAKIIYRHVGTFAKAWGYGMDAGLQAHKGNWYLGLMLKDISTTYNTWKFTFTDAEKDVLYQTNNEIPISSVEVTLPKAIIGGARKFNMKKISLIVEADVDITFDGKRNTLISSTVSADPHLGIEVDFQKIVFVRAGVGNIQNYYDVSKNGEKRITSAQPNIGIGLKLKNLTIDYALSNLGNTSTGLNSNIFSLKIALNSRKK